MDVNPVYWEREFYSYLLRLICQKGGTRLQMCTSDISTEMQKMHAKHAVNMHRKQYGNITQLLKTCKNPFFTFDSNQVKLKPKDDIDQLYVKGHISGSDYEFYVKTYQDVQKKLIQVMKINKMNKCQVCGEEYRILFNKLGACNNESKTAHIPLYDMEDDD